MQALTRARNVFVALTLGVFVAGSAGCGSSALTAGAVDSGSDVSGSDAGHAGRTGNGGTNGNGGAIGMGGATGSGGVFGNGGAVGNGGTIGMGGATGSGGVFGNGGAISGVGGSVAGVGGATSGSGGAIMGAGGAISGVGGSGVGGAIAGAGGTTSGTGGALSGVGGSGLGGDTGGGEAGASGTGGVNGAGGTASAGSTGSDGGVDAQGADGAAGAGCPALPPAGSPSGLAVEFVAGVTVSTLAGSDVAGSGEGTGATVGLDNPVSVSLAPGGDLFVLEYDANRVRRLTSAGASSTVIANGILHQPFGLVAASDSVLFLDTDYDPSGLKSATTGTIWRVDVATQSATVVKADVGRPRGVACLGDGRLVLADYRNHRVLLLDPTTATVTTLAGSGCPGLADGQGTAAQFNVPYGVAVMPDGVTIVVADWSNHRLRTVALDGTVATLAGGGDGGMIDGDVAVARFYEPQDVAVDGAGAIYVSDQGNHRIRRLAAGRVQTLAGDGTEGFANGAGQDARFYGQEGLTVSPDGHTLYVADGTNGDAVPYHRVRTLTIP